MKRVITFCLILSAIILTGCKKETVTTNYTIGCVEYFVNGESDWNGFDAYMNSVVEYNKLVQYTNHSLEENDMAAAEFFDQQVANINEAQACSFFGPGEYIRYGIARVTESGEYIIVRSIKISAQGME